MSIRIYLRKTKSYLVASLILFGQSALHPVTLSAQTSIKSTKGLVLKTQGKTESFEKELNFDLLGHAKKEQIKDITDVIRHIQGEYPKARTFNLHVKVGDIRNKKGASIDGYAVPDSNLTPEQLLASNKMEGRLINGRDNCAAGCIDIIAVNQEPALHGNPGVNMSFKGAVYHESSHLLFEKDFGSEAYIALMQRFHEANMIAQNTFAYYAKEQNISLDELMKRFKEENGYLLGFVSRYAENSKSMNQAAIQEFEKAYDSLDLGKYASKKTLAEELKLKKQLTQAKNQEEASTYRARLEEIERFQRFEREIRLTVSSFNFSEDISENISYFLQGLTRPSDEIIRMKQLAIIRFLDEVYR